ncbi:MAG: hypothetical protein M0015_09910 [Betaproteobacteria bacterium]|nr:hypothetical protein [Betaproteobacteria bacterium]
MTLRQELSFGGRRLLRDNWLCERLVAQLRRHETLGAEEIDSLQRIALRRTLLAARGRLRYCRHVPARFPAERSPEVLREHFPVICKETLLENPREHYPGSGRPKPWQGTGKTSGTTGTPLRVIRGPRSVLMEEAFLRRHWKWGGFRDGMRRATLRGDLVVPPERMRPPFWIFNRYNNQLLLSSRHLRDGCVDAIIDELESFAPRMLQAYPSAACALGQLLAQRGRRLEIPVVFTASEPLYAHQRQLIEERVGARVMDMYGMAERVAFATECELGSLHVNPDYSYVELVDDDGNSARGEGYVVGTTFHNLAMPLVRYRLTDRTRWIPGACRCGRPFPMIEPVTGKWEDAITGSGGAFVSPSVLTFAFKGLHNIRKSQVAQVGPARWEVRVVPAPGFSSEDRRRVVHNIHALVDPGVRVDLVLKDEIACTAAGKFRWVVNEWRAARAA